MREAVIVAGARTPVGKACKGSLREVHPVDMGAHVVQTVLKRAGQNISTDMLDDCIIGCAFPEGEQGMNMARQIVFRAGCPETLTAMTLNRYCASGLESIAYAASRIMLGQAEMILAGGVESMSRVPMGGHKLAPNPWLAEHMPQAYMSMGHTAEEVAKRYKVSREEQDHYALTSHQKASEALKKGLFKEEIAPITITKWEETAKGYTSSEQLFSQDEGVRADTSREVLAKLKPAFHTKGTVTAGNASQVSDGAAVLLLMSREKAESLSLRPIARFISYGVAGVAPEIMGIGPVEAVPKALKLAGLKLDDIDLCEVNEAFASQVIHVNKRLGLDSAKVNVNGGAIALGHPLGCTGARLSLSLIYEMRRRNNRYGLVTMCVGGGMGACGIFENLDH
jgi:acetyl-CoA acyltransferase